ncbi:MAG: FMN-binding protein [Bacteroidia bacterium]
MKSRLKLIQVLVFSTFIIVMLVGFSFTPVTPENALKSIYPGTFIEVKNYVLSAEQQARIEKLSGVKQDSKLVSFYHVKQQGEVRAFGYVDVHTVRTQQEAVMYVINKNAVIEEIKILSFREPPEYLAPERWLKSFQKKSLQQNKIVLRDDVSAISGATMTARAVTNNCRKALAIWQVVYGEK